MELVVSATRASYFNCKLTPKRTEMLIISYCNIYKQIKMPMDLICIIILYFNQLLYWKQKSMKTYNIPQSNEDGLGLLYQAPATADDDLYYKLNKRYDTFITTYLMVWKSAKKYIFQKSVIYWVLRGLDEVSNIYPSLNNFKFGVTDANCINLELMNGWNIIQSIVFRVRLFCIENGVEIRKLINLTSENKSIDICNHRELDKSHNSDDVNIGCQVEILHILYRDDNYWSKYPYSWFNYMIDAKIFIRDNLLSTYVNYFNSRCFKVDEKYYYLMNSVNAKLRFFQFIHHYFIEAKKLPFDIILLNSQDCDSHSYSFHEYLNANY
eukprot:378739_1